MPVCFYLLVPTCNFTHVPLPINARSYVVISPSLAGLSERLGLKRIVPMAVERGVQEILAPVVERSVTIACYTAMELVVKVSCLCVVVCLCALSFHEWHPLLSGL